MRYFKTDAGRQEIEQRSRRLPAALRSILLMIDGQRDAAELAALIESLRAPADTLRQLEDMGLIERDAVPAAETAAGKADTAGADRYKALYDLTSEAIRTHLGLKGYFLQLKVERCANAEELEALLPDVAEALARAKSDALGRRWLDAARAIGVEAATQA